MSGGYIKSLREVIGHRKFIHPAARILVENEKGEFLFIERKDNGKLGIPAGGLEEDETIEDCIIREVKEETGLEMLDIELIGISSNPNRETVQYPNGDEIQYFTLEFYSRNWKGDLNVVNSAEVKEAKFLPSKYAEKLPENERSTFQSLVHYRKEGKVRLS